ncbi:hypothetical protein KQI63_05285 [bacterium]|nr:hypothetical protein [bacterium]
MRKSNRLIIVFLALSLLLAVLAGCAEMQGDVDENRAPNVFFVNVHDSSASIVYDYAPVIQWHGNDPDGFVDHYSYADITDSAAIQNPEGYINQIPAEVWKDTIATSARIFLLSEAGDTTEHVFYVRCEDNEGMLSDIAYRTFFRTNRPPDVPKIGITGEDEDNFSERRVITSDTLFSAPEITSTFPGISFSWRGKDPDDKALFKIPLEFQAILIKSPSDTVFVRNWSDDTDITLADLETGNYTLNVWARDDGFTRSVNPARIEFYVIRPTFEHHLLVVYESNNQGTIATLPSTASSMAFYDGILQDANESLENVEFDFDGLDVQYMVINQAQITAANLPSRSLISQYQMVIFIQDQFKTASFSTSNYIPEKANLLGDYLAVGGRAWLVGRMMGGQMLNWTSASATERDIYLRYFGVSSITTTSWLRTGSLCYAEFIGSRKAIAEFPDLAYDYAKAAENWLETPGYLPNSEGQSGVERIERAQGAQTTQYIYSNTAGSLIETEPEDATVVQAVTINGVNINYPPTPTTCYLQTANPNIEEVLSVVNVTKQEAGAVNAVGEVVFVNNRTIFVSYDEGQPWADSDSLAVTYTYDPISDFHLKPCAIRYEGVDNGDVFAELRFRTALTAYSPYFMERDGVLEEWILMLDWFFNPELNSGGIIIDFDTGG